jgi:hypothetical protein
MPFHLVKIKRGWKVQDDNGNFYSNKVLTKKRATAQLRALYASYSRGETFRGKGYATYCDDDGNHHLVLQGEGFFSDIFAKVKKVAKTVASKLTTKNLQAVSEVLSTGIREDYPPDVRNVIAQYGQGQVYRLAIYREPIKSYIDTVLNIISLGQWNAAKSKLNYDKMFHLSMVASLNMPNGNKQDIKIEKNEVINITPDFKIAPNTEVQQVPVPCCITLQDMLNNGKKVMGPNFFRYDAFSNNCQAFILGILQGNHLDTPDVVQFVSQNAEQLMKELPEHIPAFAGAITNLAGFWNRLYKGQGMEFDARGIKKGGRIHSGKREPRRLKGGAEDLPWNQPNQYASFQISKSQQDAQQAERNKYKDVAGVGTKYDINDPYIDIAIGQRKQEEEAAHSLVKQSDVPDVPQWKDIPTFPNDQVPPGYTGFVKMGKFDPSKDAMQQIGDYNIIYYKDGNVIRTRLPPGAQLKYDFGALRKKLEDTWGNQYGGLHYINPHQLTTERNGEMVSYDENGNEKFDQNKHLSIDWLNSVEGRHLRDINPAFEEWFQRAKEQDDAANNRTQEQIAQRDKELEDKYQKEIEERYDPNEDWIKDMRGKTITDQYGNVQTLNQARLRNDGGFDIQYQNGKWDYMPGQDEWDCNAFMSSGDRLENQGVCGTKGRAKAANQIEKNIRADRDKQWEGMSGWDKFVNGINVAGAYTQDYVLPIVSKIAGFIPGASFIGNIADLTGDITGAIQQGQCRHFNECTEQQVEQGKEQALYHDTVGDRVANRFFNDSTMAELANHDDKVIPLLQDTYEYGSRAGKLQATGEGKPFYISNAFKRQLRQIGMTPQKYLEVVREIADEEGYDGRALEFSDDDEHKLMIYDDEGKVHKFGKVGYDDYILWSKKEAIGKAPRGYAEQKRRVFNRSHSKLPGDWKRNKFSPNNLALRILW